MPTGTVDSVWENCNGWVSLLFCADSNPIAYARIADRALRRRRGHAVPKKPQSPGRARSARSRPSVQVHRQGSLGCSKTACACRRSCITSQLACVDDASTLPISSWACLVLWRSPRQHRRCMSYAASEKLGDAFPVCVMGGCEWGIGTSHLYLGD